ncbi:ADP-ribosylglycohydrolase family protein [Paenibacillus sp. F411]|uniref:ADP-ribosylglycohydrolase family protein n=1 Tax=Paenibacillus sp. F411 TaxID=2820239 RepID=UPI001AAE612B|nr:ADP-ribosylglycohydrolase family protein [Paenibacillus sp. F411]MBO2942647.1 ADP-ribosylglycohydrolase family protein [Paenibacillus sp. F411]
MGVRILNEQDYYNTVYGGWLGKNIGGTLGAPDEGKKELLSLDFYPLLEDLPLANDDLDLQLVWLHALEQYGPKLTCKELGQEWIEHVFFPFDEYGYALTNLRRGIQAPLAGQFNNPFTNCMGSPIRSEIWGMVAPGAPHIAAHYAYQDAVVDHAGGEGVYGEMFFAAIESAIFMEKDRDKLITIGLSYIPETSRTAKALYDLLKWHKEGKDWIQARELILEHHGHDNFTDAPQNIAFTIHGWLYGKDFEDAILKAVNCGYDTDCTAATLAAILGMIAGPDGLPEKWVRPIGDRIAVSPPIKGFPAPADLAELTRRTIRMGKQVLAAWDTEIIVHPELATQMDDASVEANDRVRTLWDREATMDRRLLPQGSTEPLGLELLIEYGDMGPAISRQQNKTLRLTLVNHSLEPWKGTLGLNLPSTWKGTPEQSFKLEAGQGKRFDFEVRMEGALAPAYELTAVITRLHDQSVWAELNEAIVLVPANEWIVWGPGQTEGVKASFTGNRLDWDQCLGTKQDGEYRAKTTIYNPSERKIRLITASNHAVTASLNGEVIIECTTMEELMPAYHRAPKSQFSEFILPEGMHELEITARQTGTQLEVYVLPVAVQNTETPGPYYYYTDILFTV